MIHFPDTTLQRYSYNENSTGVYGETVGTYTYTNDILVDFQNETNQEIAHAYGVELKDLFKIYIDHDTTLLESDQLHNTNGDVYTIIGGIQEYKKFHHYKKAHIIRHRRSKT